MTKRGAGAAGVFLRELFGDALAANATLLLWELPSKRSTFVMDYKVADTKIAEMLKRGADVYFGVGLRDGGKFKPGAQAARGGNQDVTTIGGLWVDLDVAEGYFASKPDALAFLAGLPMKPTTVVCSGGGYHAWWMFHEPYICDGPEDVTVMQELVYGWQCFIREEAEVSVDNTHDLARVLRPPGTVNRKGGKERACVLVDDLTDWDKRYDAGEFEVWQRPVRGSMAAGAANGATLVLRADAVPPMEAFALLMDIDSMFRRTIARRRTDFKGKGGKVSASEYDLALCNIAVQAGWTDQQIADLCIWHRGQHNDPLKLREDYYQRTIALARATFGVDDNKTEAKQEEAKLKQELTDEPGMEASRAFAVLKQFTGIPVTRIVRQGPDDVQYRVYIDGRERPYDMGAITKLKAFERWWNLGADCGIHPLPRAAPKPVMWRGLMNKILPHIETDDSVDSDRRGIMLVWVAGYEFDAVIMDELEEERQRIDIIEQGGPFHADGLLHVNADHFRIWLRRNKGETLKPGQLVSGLKLAGLVPLHYQKRITEEGQEARRKQGRRQRKVIGRHYWTMASGEVE